jgi:hypothetical protein
VLEKFTPLSAMRRSRDAFSFWSTVLFFIALVVSLLLFCAFVTYPQKINGIGLFLMRGELKQIVSPLSGMIESWLKEEGDAIEIGDALAVIRDHDDPDNTKQVTARVRGVIAEVIAYANTSVLKGQAIAIISNFGDPRKDLELVGFVSSLAGKKIKPSMKALIDPTTSNPYVAGHLLGTVKRVGRLPMTKAAVQSVIKIPEMAKYIRSKIDAEPFVVILSLVPNETHKSGYLWSGPGPSFELDSGVLADISIIIDEPTILSLLWPSIFYRHPGEK